MADKSLADIAAGYRPAPQLSLADLWRQYNDVGGATDVAALRGYAGELPAPSVKPSIGIKDIYGALGTVRDMAGGPIGLLSMVGSDRADVIPDIKLSRAVGTIGEGMADWVRGPQRAMRGEMGREEMADWGAETALGMIGGGRLAGGAPAGSVGSSGAKLIQPEGIRAYHGSPHDFDRFSLSKIGTGEGAQAYGHGLYFAENEGVARSYRDAVTQSQMPRGGFHNQRFVTGLDDAGSGSVLPEFMDFGTIIPASGGASNAKLLDNARANLRSAEFVRGPLRADAIAKAQRAIDYLEATPSARVVATPYEGRMYEVNIAAKPEQFLDWDKPLSAQPSAIRNMMGEHIGPRTDTYGNMRARFYAPMDEILRGTEAGRFTKGENYFTPGAVNIDAVRASVGSEKAAQIDALLAKHQKDMEMSGADAYRSIPSGSEATSQQLAEAGIPGIRYLDQGSRNPGFSSLTPAQLDARIDSLRGDIAGGGGNQQRMRDQLTALERERDTYKNQTSNYAVFDDSLIDIRRKYGIAGLPAAGVAGAAGAALSDQQVQ